MQTMLAPAPILERPADPPAAAAGAAPAAVDPTPPAVAAVPSATPTRPVATATATAAATASAAVTIDGDLVGKTLNNRYLVKARIGEGGFGAVYSGEQVAMGRECAIKVLHGRMARDPQVVGRFRREAQAASVLRAAHTVQIYDFDQTPEGVLFLAMELLHGRSLLHEMAKGPMDHRRVAHILDGIAESLGEAHKHGIVHRDIKPENVFLETRGNDTDYAKVLDFGIAKIVSGDGQLSGPQLTAAGQTLGTLEYMSPEQLMGAQLDGRSDLYALGMLAYEMLAGQHPYHAHLKHPGEIITAHIKTTPPPPSQGRAELGIPPLMDQIVLRLIEKARDKRFKDATELQSELRKVVAGETGKFLTIAEEGGGGNMLATTTPDLKPIAIEEAPPPSGAPTVPSMGVTDAAQKRSSRTTIMVVAGVVLALIAIGLAMLLFANKADADELPQPARMIPSSFEALFSVDLEKLRASLPKNAVAPMVQALQPALAEIGVDANKMGPLAIGLDHDGRPVRDESSIGPSLFIVDAPVNRKRFEKWAAKELLGTDGKFVGASYKGVKYMKSSTGEYAFLPGGRLVIASSVALAAPVDLLHGQGTPLVEGEAASLLGRVGATAAVKPVLYGWAKVDDPTRRELSRVVQGAGTLDEMSAAVTVGGSGADVRAAGRCASPEGATQAADAARAAIEHGRHNQMLMLFGLSALFDAIKVETDGPLLLMSLHLSAEQYADLVTRLAGALSAAAHDAAQAHEEPAEKPVAVKRRARAHK
jgi:tRNA A-37 threonylcarbamoyl transferase component Bud32